jgi:hypothetical protein
MSEDAPQIADHFEEFTNALYSHLKAQSETRGDTWLERPLRGQIARIYRRYATYFLEWLKSGVPVPWLKIAGLAYIAWLRDSYPELFPDPEEKENE